jgi:Ferritin-like
VRERTIRQLSLADATDLHAPLALELADVGVQKPDELGWWDWTVFLLHTAAEIEHALLVQYLYAAFSLAEADFSGASVPPDAAQRTGAWRATIVGIAIQEMTHLFSIQNLLRFVGGPLNFEREDFPFLAFLYPFELQLEPLTKTSLAKYVAAEMPASPPQPPALIQEIVQRATGAVGGHPVNRVGVLYAALIDLFSDQTKLPDSDLRPDTADTVQADPGQWEIFDQALAHVVRTRDDAIERLRFIAQQGEGLEMPPPGSPPSHFERFLGIYTAFPEADAWTPALPVPVNPNTLHQPSTDPGLERGRITHPTTRLWAHLFNVRYRLLLLDLAHALQQAQPTLRDKLREWTFQEMRGRGSAGVKNLARVLTTLPLKDSSGAERAGSPFELPYTLSLPDDERARWRLHLALLDSSADLVAAIQAASGSHPALAELTQMDQDARPLIQQQVNP